MTWYKNREGVTTTSRIYHYNEIAPPDFSATSIQTRMQSNGFGVAGNGWYHHAPTFAHRATAYYLSISPGSPFDANYITNANGADLSDPTDRVCCRLWCR